MGWPDYSLGYTISCLALDDKDRLKMHNDLFEAIALNETFIGKMARMIQYLETRSAVPEKDELYRTFLTMLNESLGIEAL